MFAKLLVGLTALVASSTTALAFSVDCEQNLSELETTRLPRKDYARFELDEAVQCRWLSEEAAPTPSILFRTSHSKSTVEIEIATYLTVKGTTATHVAFLDANYQTIKWIPFTAFKERKGSLAARFFLNPDDKVKYILVGGAANAQELSLARTYSPLTSDLLNVARLVTSRELQTEFNFIPTGKIRVRIRKPKNKTVKITR